MALWKGTMVTGERFTPDREVILDPVPSSQSASAERQAH